MADPWANLIEGSLYDTFDRSRRAAMGPRDDEGGGTGTGGLRGWDALLSDVAPPRRQQRRETSRFDGSLREGVIETAEAIGADPVDLATAISYETGGTFDPLQPGPTTKWGQHRGLIQFGEPQAREHGVDFSSPEAALSSQLGADGAVANYFRSSGFQPGMSGLDLYSTINAGAPGRYGASDTAAGGAPGDVADKWNNQMTDHRRKAEALIGGQSGGAQRNVSPRLWLDLRDM